MEVFTVETKHGPRRWKLTAKCKREIGPIAEEFGLELKKFLYLYSQNSLPGQLPRHNDIDEWHTPPGFSVSPCTDQTTWERVERAARHDKISVKAFVWMAIANSVNCSEENMIMNPTTGECLSTLCMIETFLIPNELHEI